MYGAAIAFSSVGAVASLPHFQMGSLDIGVPIQAFGVIVAIGVLIGAALLRRYAEWHGISDEHIRGLLGWITITGFLGAHWLDTFMYEPHKLYEPIATWPPSKWPVLLRIWDGISSYGGFVGGAAGFAFYVWWKRLPVRLFADTAIVGLLPAFSIGRIGCTVVSDHIGAVVDKANWYAFLAMDYPRPTGMVCTTQTHDFSPVQLAHNEQLCNGATNLGDTITMWNLGLVELLYLIPVNIILLRIAFRPTKRPPAGFIAVLAGILYSPVRFFIDFLRPETTDPRHFGLTFAQWASIAAFGVCTYVASRIMKGKPSDVVAPTAKEAQEKLKLVLKEEEEAEEAEKSKAKVVEKKASKKEEPKASGIKKKAEEVPPTEPMLDALPKDIVKKVEDTKKAKAAEKKAEEKAEKKADEKAEKKEEKAEKKAEEKAEKKVEKAEEKAEKAEDTVEKKVEKAEEKVEKKADQKAEEKAEKADEKPATEK